MQHIQAKIASRNWEQIAEEMNNKGFAIIPRLLTNEQAEVLKTNYDDPAAYRKTIVMERYRFGLGEYKYFDYPLPDIIQTIREEVYSMLAPVANAWMKALNIDTQFPATLADMQAFCQANNQSKATVLILKYGKGGHNTLTRTCMEMFIFPFRRCCS